MRPVRADDYDEPLRGMIERGELEPPDECVIDDADVARDYCETCGRFVPDGGCPACGGETT